MLTANFLKEVDELEHIESNGGYKLCVTFIDLIKIIL
jgi:hypothetical protein